MTIRRVHFFTAAKKRILPGRGKRSRKRGYIMIMLSLGLPFLLGVTGMAIDIGRMYITKSEAQHFVDSAAINATLALDGKSTGITAAQTAVSTTPLAYGFGQTVFPTASTVTTFGTDPAGAFTATPPNPPTNYNYVQVMTQVNVPMYLMRILVGPNAQVAASAIAGWAPTTTLPNGGEFPFSPYTRGYAGAREDDPAHPDPYGYKINNKYTMLWGAPGNKTNCGTDNSVPAAPGVSGPGLADNNNVRGYCCVSTSGSGLRQAIVGTLTDPVTIGANVNMYNGDKNTMTGAIAWRVNLDTDTTTTSYDDYLEHGNGNGMRVVMVPVNGGPPNYTLVGFAGFFLGPSSLYNGLNGNDAACGTYIGQFRQGQANPPPGAGAAHVRLF